MLTAPVPQLSPPRACDTPSQSANDAPSGRVTMYANQNAMIAFKPNQRWATAGTAVARRQSAAVGVNDPTPPSLYPYHLVTQETVFTPANMAIKSYAEVDRSGMTPDQLARFATNLKLSASVLHAADLSAADMRASLITAIGQPDSRVIVNFNRASLGQEGEGHFSPLVAYDPASDSFLILDVARYKYPPAWVNSKDLDISIRTVDPDSGLSRGALIVTRAVAPN